MNKEERKQKKIEDHRRYCTEEFNRLLPLLNELIKLVELTDKRKEYDVRGAKFLIRQRRDAFAQEDIIEMSLGNESPIFPTIAYIPISNSEAKLLYYRLGDKFRSHLRRATNGDGLD